ncbi:MAG: hypothetical protein JSW39_19930 [Desulfobacterales bacterium]|nr:MAG: hypothetical protein JSW39_19930 [Desulfobacterales bacterium]
MVEKLGEGLSFHRKTGNEVEIASLIKKRKPNKRLALVNLTSGLVITGFSKSTSDHPTAPRSPFTCSSIFAQVQYRLRLPNLSGRKVRKADSGVSASVRRSATQPSVSPKSSDPFQSRTDAVGRQILHLCLCVRAHYAPRIIRSKAEALLFGNTESRPPCFRSAHIPPKKDIEFDPPGSNRRASRLRTFSIRVADKKIFSWRAATRLPLAAPKMMRELIVKETKKSGTADVLRIFRSYPGEMSGKVVVRAEK